MGKNLPFLTLGDDAITDRGYPDFTPLCRSGTVAADRVPAYGFPGSGQAQGGAARPGPSAAQRPKP